MYEGAGLGPADVDIFNPYDGYAPMTQFFLEAFQWHGVKRGDAFGFYAGDIRVEGPHPLCSSGGNLGNGRTRTAMYTDCIEQLPRHGWRTAGHGSGGDRAGGIHHAKQWGVDHVRGEPELRGVAQRSPARGDRIMQQAHCLREPRRVGAAPLVPKISISDASPDLETITGVARRVASPPNRSYSRRRDQPDLVTARNRGPFQYKQGKNVRPRFTPWPVFVWLNRRRSLFTDHCPIWHASGWMALCLEAIVFILTPGDAIAISITMEVLTAAAQRERWRDRQRQGGGENDGTQ